MGLTEGRRAEGVVIRVHLNAGLRHGGAGLQVRNLKSRLGIEVQRRRHVVGPEPALDGRLEDGQDGLLLVEFDFNLRRVDVHVEPGGVHREVQGVQRVAAFGNELLVGTDDGAVQQPVLDKAAVDEQELLASRASGRIRLAHKPLDLDDVGVFLDRHKALVVFGPQNAHHPLTQRPGLQGKQVVALVRQRKRKPRMGEGHTLKFVHHMAQLHGVGLQEIPTGRHVVKQVLHVKGGAHGTRLGFFAGHFGPVARQFHPHLRGFLAGGDLDVRDGRNRSQRLTTEALGGQVEQVVRRGQLARGVPNEAQTRVLGRHAGPVVHDLNGRPPRIQHVHLDRSGAGVHGVFHQLLDHRSRPLDDFTRGNLVGHVVRQDVNRLAHPLAFMNCRNPP